jgi:hypothetical protein
MRGEEIVNCDGETQQAATQLNLESEKMHSLML